MEIRKSAVLSVVVLASVLLAACSTPSKKNAVINYAAPEFGNTATVAPVAVKDFEIKGVIFLESKVTTDVNGNENGSAITYDMLMREAVKLGADDVINIRIDKIENAKAIDTYNKNTITSEETFVSRQYTAKELVYKANALAIKYTKALENGRPADVSGTLIKPAKVMTENLAPVTSTSSKTKPSGEKATSVFSGK